MSSKIDDIKARAGDKKLLITGTGRCGTFYASKVFDLPHETTFNNYMRFETKHDSEVSCIAVPYLWLLNREEWYVVHLIRHPQRVVGSIQATWVNGGLDLGFLEWHYFTRDPVVYYRRVMERMDRFCPEETLKVEDLGESTLNSIIATLVHPADDLMEYIERWGYKPLDTWGDPLYDKT